MPSSKFSTLVSLLYCLSWFSLCESDASYPQDTYIKALQTLHQTDAESTGDFGAYNYSPPPNNQYLPPSTPAPLYGPPAPIYGTPVSVYGPPQHNYYKPIPSSYHPRDHLTLLEKLKSKDMFKDDMSMDEDGAESKQVETERDVLEQRIEELYEYAIKAFNKFKENK